MFIPQMFRGKSRSGSGFWETMLGGVSSSQSKAGIIITPEPHLINLESGRKEALPVDDDGYGSAPAIFWVITYIINDARNAEFDDCPAM